MSNYIKHTFKILKYYTHYITFITLLFLRDESPDNLLKVAAFFYEHGVPLGVACRVYTICNKEGSHLVPYVMGTFYSKWVTNTDSLHMAQYYNVRGEKNPLDQCSKSVTVRNCLSLPK